MAHRLVRHAQQAAVAAAAAALVLAGCAGYQVGNRTLFPCEVETVHVPIFESESFRRNLGEQLTEAVVKQIELRTPYKVVSADRADSVLRGIITTEQKWTTIYSMTAEPRQQETMLVVRVDWKKTGSGEVVRRIDPIPIGSPEVQARAGYVPEFGQSLATAHQQAIQRAAAEIVALMEVPW